MNSILYVTTCRLFTVFFLYRWISCFEYDRSIMWKVVVSSYYGWEVFVWTRRAVDLQIFRRCSWLLRRWIGRSRSGGHADESDGNSWFRVVSKGFNCCCWCCCFCCCGPELPCPAWDKRSTRKAIYCKVHLPSIVVFSSLTCVSMVFFSSASRTWTNGFVYEINTSSQYNKLPIKSHNLKII